MTPGDCLLWPRPSRTRCFGSGPITREDDTPASVEGGRGISSWEHRQPQTCPSRGSCTEGAPAANAATQGRGLPGRTLPLALREVAGGRGERRWLLWGPQSHLNTRGLEGYLTGLLASPGCGRQRGVGFQKLCAPAVKTAVIKIKSRKRRVK